MMRLFQRRREGVAEAEAEEAKSEMRPLAGSAADDAPTQPADYSPWSPEEADPAVPASDPVATPSSPEAEPRSLREGVTEALKTVYDPEIPVSIFDLGLIYDIQISPEREVLVKMTLTAPACPVAEQMPAMVQQAVEDHVPEVGLVEVEIVWEPPWNPDMMSEAARLELGFM
jgi:FeS assembly SUF system protein